MKPASALVLSLALAPIAIFAQYTPPPPASSYGVAAMEQVTPNGSTASNTPVNAPPKTATLPNGCPAAFSVQHLPDGDFVKTGIAHPKGIGQGLHLKFLPGASGIIAEAVINVRGWTPEGRFSQAAPESRPNAVRRMHIQLKPGSDQSAVADLWVSGLSAITSVEIVSATYAGGSTWTPSGKAACRVAPDLFMPVHP